MYDMLGNAWEWVSDEFKDKGRETKYVLRGGSYIDTADGKHNHKVTVTTRYAQPFWKIMILVLHTGYMQCFPVLYKGISYESLVYFSVYILHPFHGCLYHVGENTVANTISATQCVAHDGKVRKYVYSGFS